MITIICHNQVAKIDPTLLDIERLLLSKCKENGPQLRTVPTIVIAHTFCASPDTRISYRQC